MSGTISARSASKPDARVARRAAQSPDLWVVFTRERGRSRDLLLRALVVALLL